MVFVIVIESRDHEIDGRASKYSLNEQDRTTIRVQERHKTQILPWLPWHTKMFLKGTCRHEHQTQQKYYGPNRLSLSPPVLKDTKWCAYVYNCNKLSVHNSWYLFRPDYYIRLLSSQAKIKLKYKTLHAFIKYSPECSFFWHFLVRRWRN